MRRRSALLVAALVACSVLAPASFTTGADAQEATPIDDCTVIDDPGEYELTGDVQTDESGECIEVRADDVSIQGNGHTLRGPGADADATGVDLGSGEEYSQDVELRNLEITDWGDGVHAAGTYELTDAVVRGNERGLYHRQGSAQYLDNVTIEDNDVGISSIVGGAAGTDVVIRENRVGLSAEDGGTYEFDNARIVDNDEEGAYVGHHTGLVLSESTVSGNGEEGIGKIHSEGPGELYLEDTIVSDNGAEGILIRGPNEVHLQQVTVEGNDGLEVDAYQDEQFNTEISATDLHVGGSATLGFEQEAVTLEPVDREDLPEREDGDPAGDGLEVDGSVEDQVDLALDVDTDDDTVDLWRHDGDDWETVAEGLDAADGTVEASVDRTGLYVPGTDGDGSNGGSGDATAIDSCTVIDEPGEYELTEDVQTDADEDCIHVQADDVTIDGNGHSLVGPGPDADAVGIYLGSDGDNVGLTVRNLEIAGWDDGLRAGGDYEMSDATVRNNDVGLNHRQGSGDLTNVTVRENDLGMFAMMGGASGTDVTVAENRRGLTTVDGGGYDLESAEVVDNEEYGLRIEHSSELHLRDSVVSGNGGHGVHLPHYGMPVQGYIEDTVVADNGGDGVRASSSEPEYDELHLDAVVLEGNDGYELNAAGDEQDGSGVYPMPTDATDVQVGPAATVAFEDESPRLEPVDREALPAREGGTVAGDGLTVGWNVSDGVAVELAVAADEETVDLWRHDGDDWETVAEDLDAADGTIEATVERTGTYAPGTDDESDDDPTPTETPTPTATPTPTETPSDDDPTPTETPADDDPTPTATPTPTQTPTTSPSDKDGEKKTHTPTETPTDDDGEKTHTPTETEADSSGGSGGSSGSGGSGGAGGSSGDTDGSSTTATATATDAATATDEPTETQASGATGTPESDEQAADDTATDEDVVDDEDSVLADGPGFTPVAAVVALLAAALLTRRRR